MELVANIWPYVSLHPYLFLFLGMLVGGETFLLPAAYLAAKGTLTFPLVIFFASLATLVSDTTWYFMGCFFQLEKILSWKIFFKKREISLKIFSVFKEHSRKLLFISKFVYGTRTLIQVLSGAIRMPFFLYTAVNLFGIMSYLMVISLAALLTKKSLANFAGISYNEYVSAAIFIFVIVLIHICLKKWLGKKLIAPSSQPGTKSGQ
ncbi:hypothetical protein HYW73_01110 [Candidatus Nomurabacteria bacterium]|nr:hypothetical protein [Candidatus Nomurabacteria bacterium]